MPHEAHLCAYYWRRARQFAADKTDDWPSAHVVSVLAFPAVRYHGGKINAMLRAGDTEQLKDACRDWCRALLKEPPQEEKHANHPTCD